MAPIDFARGAAPTLEGYGVADLYKYVGGSVEWGREIRSELLTGNILKETYQKVAMEICCHAPIEENPDYVARVLCMMACNQWILKRALLHTLPAS